MLSLNLFSTWSKKIRHIAHEFFSAPKSVNTETSSENLTLSRKRPRSGPEIIDNGGALKITGRSMSCSVCKVHVSAKNKKDRVQTKYCCVSCHEPVCLKKHAQVICFRCFGEKWLSNKFIYIFMKNAFYKICHRFGYFLCLKKRCFSSIYFEKIQSIDISQCKVFKFCEIIECGVL